LNNYLFFLNKFAYLLNTGRVATHKKSPSVNSRGASGRKSGVVAG
jgi:hypothetical protein